MSTFDKVSGQYQQKALVQQAAAERLLALLDIAEKDDVLDVGCGPGHITERIKALTLGRVVGTDISGGMIAQARAKYPAIDFRQLAAEKLDYQEGFDVVFCNSALQWFGPTAKAVKAMCVALRPGGRIGVACPAADNWSVCFKAVAAEAGAHADTSAAFAHCKPPWVYLPDEQSYQRLFQAAGLATDLCRIELEEHHYDTEQAIAVFASGAAQGYTTKEFYEVPIDEEYVRRFNQYTRQAIERRAIAGKVIVDFRRLYYVGRKPHARQRPTLQWKVIHRRLIGHKRARPLHERRASFHWLLFTNDGSLIIAPEW